MLAISFRTGTKPQPDRAVEVGHDFALRLEASFPEDAQDSRIEFRATAAEGDRSSEVRAPALTSSPAGWALELSDPAIVKHLKPDWNSIWLCAYGERITVDVNAKRATSFDHAEAGPGGRLMLRGAAYRKVELLAK